MICGLVASFSQNKIGLYPIYFETQTQKTNFEDSYINNGYRYVDAKHPLMAFVKQDTSWYWFNYVTSKRFVKLPDKEGSGAGAISEIIDTIPLGIGEGGYVIAKHVDGRGDTTQIIVPNLLYINNVPTLKKHNIGNIFANGDGFPKSVYETITSMSIVGDSIIRYVDENGTATNIQVDKTIYGYPVSGNNPVNGQILKFNGTTYVPADDEVSGGTGVDGVVTSAAFSGTSTKTLTLTRSNGLSNLTANFTDNVNDADYDPANEIQTLSLLDSINRVFRLQISGGNIVKIKDTKLTQEEVEDYAGAMVSGNTETGITVTYQDTDGTIDYVAADVSSSNELQTISKDMGTGVVTLSQGGGSFTDAVNDADYDPNNENQTVSAGFGIDVTQSVQNYQVKADTAELASLWRLNQLKDYFNFDWSVVKNLTANTAVAIKQTEGAGIGSYNSYTTVLGSYLEFIQGYIDQKNTGNINYSIKVYKKTKGPTTLINTISLSSTGIGKYYYSYKYSATSFDEGDEFFATITSNSNITEVLINYSIYFSRDPRWTGIRE